MLLATSDTSSPPTATQLTGLKLELSLMLRTRLLAVPAGLSPPLDPSKVPTRLPPVNLFLFPNSNLLTAPSPTVTSVAWVVSWTVLSTMLRMLLSTLSLIILTRDGLSVAASSPLKVLSKLPLTLMFLPTIQLSLRPILPRDLSLLLLMLLVFNSSFTRLVLSLKPLAEPTSTTVSSSSVWVKKTVPSTGSLRTPGIPLGVKTVTSDSRELTPRMLVPVVSNPKPPKFTFDSSKAYLYQEISMSY
mmetsp:Transcript_24283/g.17097  ORF Transcript_24283/g.17097 Transcript_24283/m.17097 type:complete len:245 (+) Transcript_24283:340-1074(+)